MWHWWMLGVTCYQHGNLCIYQGHCSFLCWSVEQRLSGKWEVFFFPWLTINHTCWQLTVDHATVGKCTCGINSVVNGCFRQFQVIVKILTHLHGMEALLNCINLTCSFAVVMSQSVGCEIGLLTRKLLFCFTHSVPGHIWKGKYVLETSTSH